MPYRYHGPPEPLLIGYDPVRDLPSDHLARLVERVVEVAVDPPSKPRGCGQPEYDPRLCVKVLVYGYATGVRASRKLEQLCRESLPFLYLTRGEAPSYRTLCTARRACEGELEAVFVGLYAIAEEAGIRRLGRLVVDSTKLRANASPEAVVKASEYEAVKAEVGRILKEAEEADAQEGAENASETQLGAEVPPEQMRSILRRVRKEIAASKRGVREAESSGAAPEPVCGQPVPEEELRRLSARMKRRVGDAVEAIEEAEAEGRKHVCLTDPDARMMGEGREKRIRECHAWEVAVDNGLIVAQGATQQNNDNSRLEPLVEAAKSQEPGGIVALDADSGYYGGDAVANLILAGVDVCIPEVQTACDLRRGQPVGTERTRLSGSVRFEYVPEADCFLCPQGNRLNRKQDRRHCGQQVRVYRAKHACVACPLAEACLRAGAKRRTLKVSYHAEVLARARERFAEEDHVKRYHHRAAAVEGIFGFLRGVLGYARWLLRGRAGVTAEARLFSLAYQLRKVHKAWAAA